MQDVLVKVLLLKILLSKSYILIDFSKGNKDIENYFSKYLNDLDTFFMLISTHYGIEIENRNSLIILMKYKCFLRLEQQ